MGLAVIAVVPVSFLLIHPPSLRPRLFSISLGSGIGDWGTLLMLVVVVIGMAVYGTTIFEICGPKGRNALCRDLAGYLFQLAFRCSRLDNVAGAVKIQGTGEQLGLSLRLRKI